MSGSFNIIGKGFRRYDSPHLSHQTGLTASAGRGSVRGELDSLSEAVIITDPVTGGIRYTNPAAQRLLGYSLKEISGWALPAILMSKNELWQSTEHGLKSLRGIDEKPMTLLCRNGGQIGVQIWKLPLPPSMGDGYILEAANGRLVSNLADAV